MNYEGKRGDLILPQGTFVFIQDGASGQVQAAVGPYKESIGDIDKVVIFDTSSKLFIPQSEFGRAIQTLCSADEGQYIILTNPADPKDGEPRFPNKGKNSTNVQLKFGSKVNLPGPITFPLWPGQIGDVLNGHNLKYNEYLIVRVYNEEEAKKNISNAIIKTTDESEQVKTLIDKRELVTGKLLVIKGTDVSFYIPPTGIEVVSLGNSYVRKAVSLERLEYCILLDQNGDKRYVKGPDVVFPKPTEEFLELDGNKKFKALELNDNMGIYLKVIADYSEDGAEHKTGEELFITGKEQKIYFPREEHAIVKYDNNTMHYAVAITEGEARYVLDKVTGQVRLVKGPKMYLPDPRKEVIVKRVLDTKTVKLWFPTSSDALEYNQGLESEMDDFLDEYSNSGRNYVATKGVSRGIKYASANASAFTVSDQMSRKSSFTKPRTITMDNKYEGAVTISVWPGYAIQVVKKTGEREVVVGPKVKLLEFDETLEVLELSTGKPKTDYDLMRTVYLQTENNIVSDIVDAETKDLVDVSIRLSYRVNFVGDNKKWFSVSNYIKLMTQHLRSIIRNKVKKINIEEFNNDAADIIRDIILGTSTEDKARTGKTFPENGMSIYDVEILNVRIGDEDISYYLKDFQKHVVKENLAINKLTKDLENTKKKESLTREKRQELASTSILEAKLQEEEDIRKAKLEELRLANNKAQYLLTQEVQDLQLEAKKVRDEHDIAISKEVTEIRTAELEKKMASIQPKMIEAMITVGGVQTAKILAENIKQQGGDWTDLFRKGGVEGLLDSVKGTPLYDNLKGLLANNA